MYLVILKDGLYERKHTSERVHQKISFKKYWIQSDMVAHACNCVYQRLSQEDCELEASLGYTARPYLRGKKKKKIP
jgi:hypothetical protein